MEFTFTPKEGWLIKGADDGHIAHATAKIAYDAFDKYECTEKMVLHLDMLELAKVLKICENSDALIMRYEKGSDEMLFRIEREKNVQYQLCEVTLRLSEESEAVSTSPVRFSDNWVEFSSTEFARIVNNLASFCGDLKLKLGNDKLTLYSSGEVGTGNISINSHSEGKLISHTNNLTYEKEFSMRYMQTFAKSSTCSPCRVSFHFEEGKQLTIRFPLFSTKDNSSEQKLTEGQGFIAFEIADKIS